MLVSSTPETTNPVSDQCELEKKPCISTVAPWQPWFFGRGGKPDKGFDYTYHFFWGLEDIIGTFVSMWNALSTNKTVGGLFPNDGDGNAWGDKTLGFPPALAKDGYKIVDPGRYQNLTQDFSAQIQAFRDAKAEILTGVPIPPDFTTFWNQALQKGFKPKIASVGKALLFPASVEALGDNGNGLSTEVWWTPTYPFKSTLSGQSCRQLGDAYEAATGKQWTQPIGFKHANLEVAIDVLKRAKSLKPEDIRDAIKATEYNSLVGPLTWKGGTPQNPVPNPQVGLATLDGAQNTVPSFITASGPVREARFVSLDATNSHAGLDGGVHALYTIQGRSDALGCTLAQPNFSQQLTLGNVIFRVPTPTFGLRLPICTSSWSS